MAKQIQNIKFTFCTSDFINYIKFTETAKGCYVGIDQVGSLTPIIKTDIKITYMNKRIYKGIKKSVIIPLFSTSC